MARNLHIFRTFCTNPIARDPRVPIDWKRSVVPGIAWQAQLTGNDKVHLYWHKNSYCKDLIKDKSSKRPEPRAPTALCVNILLGLLYLALEQDTDTLEFSSMIKMTRMTHCYISDHRYRIWITDALRLWQLLRVSWPSVTLPPPIESIQVTRGVGLRLKIKFRKEWLTRCRNNGTVRVRLPLPMQSTPLNIILWTLGLPPQLRKNLNINAFTRKVSGNAYAFNDNRVYMPLSSWIVVREWYEERNGKIIWQRAPYKFGIRHTGAPGLIPSRTFSILHLRRPR